ncbi:hypothetical protein G7Y79_00009g026980 [Physcia stellaris]|nr:hypothetical protein G7Y79_00009g026980 [Physcia stellaris]
MQEHIRRAHPEHYISKLPATEESFQLMINTPPSERPPPSSQPSEPPVYGHDREPRLPQVQAPAPAPSRILEDAYPAAATAAVALAQLHNHRPESDWDSDAKRDKPARPRKSSITKNNRRPKHERGMSKEYARRLSIEGRKAFSAEPASAMGKRWEDLIEAATSANEADSDRDLTPEDTHTHPCTHIQIPQSPHSHKRASLPPFSAPGPHNHFESYKASPLARALTPPPPSNTDLDPFPSVESGLESTHTHSTSQSSAQVREGQGAEVVEEDLARGAGGWERDTSLSNWISGEVDGFMKINL